VVNDLFIGVEGVCFDLFHTLVDVGSVPESMGGCTADILGLDRVAWNRACFSGAHDICQPTTHLEVIRAMAHHLDPGIPMDRIEAATEARQRRFDHALKMVEPEVVATLSQLRSMGLSLALVSNASTAEVAAWPDSPLAPLFDAALFSCECGSAKPEPTIYREAAGALGVAAEQCLFVGDGGSNEHSGAAAVGMRPVMINRHVVDSLEAAALAERRSKVRHEIERLEELVALLGG